MSRLATAEKLESAEPIVVPDPFAGPIAAPLPVAPPASPPDRFAPAAPMSLASPIPLATDPRARRQTPWMAIGMVGAFVGFGGMAGYAVFFRPAPQPAPVVVQVPGAPIAAAPAAAALPSAAATDAPQPAAPAAPARVAVAGAGGGPKVAAAAPASPPAPPARGPLDLHSLTQNQTNVAPTDDPSGDAPRAPGQCFSQGQVQQFVSTHQAAMQRTCWERNPTNRLASNVSVTLTVDPDGSVQGVSASGDEASIAKCIENEVRNWHFPGMGCSQKMNIPFHFVRQ
jgi:hypothetical protein